MCVVCTQRRHKSPFLEEISARLIIITSVSLHMWWVFMKKIYVNEDWSWSKMPVASSNNNKNGPNANNNSSNNNNNYQAPHTVTSNSDGAQSNAANSPANSTRKRPLSSAAGSAAAAAAAAAAHATPSSNSPPLSHWDTRRHLSGSRPRSRYSSVRQCPKMQWTSLIVAT